MLLHGTLMSSLLGVRHVTCQRNGKTAKGLIVVPRHAGTTIASAPFHTVLLARAAASFRVFRGSLFLSYCYYSTSRS